MSFSSDIKYQWQHGGPTIKLVLVNIGIFLIQAAGSIIGGIFGMRESYLQFISEWFYASSDILELLTKPWTLFTYMFMHDLQSVFHVLFNMMYLFFFGRIFSDIMQPKMIYPLYLAGGLVGLIFSIATYNLIPDYHAYIGTATVGASAAIMAIVLATATLQPTYTVHLMFIGPVQLKYIAAFVLIIDLLSISNNDNLGGHITHLGGALTGFLYIRSYKRSGNWFGWWGKFERRVYGLFHPVKTRVAYVNPNQRPTARQHALDEQDKVDAILDKIRESGYDSLSKSEKEFLFKISNKK
ncbi:MAG TPA: rhomboid family intramembrane serine protease [Chitinophagales bacterium]|nr:rhomboid family intramembrane serine protease [Chitinophagales bacterium]